MSSDELASTSYRVLFEATRSPYLVLAADAPRFTITGVNAAYLRATMTERESLIGRGVFEAFPNNPDDLEASGIGDLRRSLERALAERGTDAMAMLRYDIRRPDGSFEKRYWNPTNTAMLNAASEPIGILHHAVDVTEYVLLRTRGAELDRQSQRLEAEVVARVQRLKEANERLRASEERQRDALKRKDEFLIMLAHELRNPLAPICSGLELMRRQDNTPAAAMKIRDMMERQTKHMVRLVDDLLDASRVTSGKIRLQRVPTLLELLVESAVDAHRETFLIKRIAFAAELPSTPYLIDVDPTRFVQVVSNLLHNAAKFTGPGGSVRLVALVADSDASTVGPQLSISVSDTGIGIGSDLLPRVFDMFAQGQSESSHAGLGIGLALARQLVEMHGGGIEARSEGAGRGTELVFHVPVGAPSAQAEATEMFDATRPQTPAVA